ncbi:TatD family hydrolase [Alteromonas sp. CYL-A6]|uniref:TatD family hydrolase n=1 Tax=Alteromonas nitratireducens TaxID=3390813 RepID=UPI0034BF7787
MSWFDGGVNLTDPRLDADAVIAEACSAEVTRLCVITTEPSEWDRARALHQAYPEHICYTLGIHPHNAKNATDADFARLRTLLSEPGVVAVGECGLDFNRNFSPPDVQQSVFQQQLAIAADCGLPVYLHERDAIDTQMSCLSPYLASLSGGIAHCFTQGADALRRYLDCGLYIGITGWVCDPKRGDALRACLADIPSDRLILETDAPYLFPKTAKPRRRNNSPALIPHIGEQVSTILSQPADLIRKTSYANACRLFGIEKA